MDVRNLTNNQSGQSLLEFLLLLPMMLGLTFLMIKVNTAIQVGIVDQQYARAQTLWLAFNSNTYPQIKLREAQLTAQKFNQMTLGVSDLTVSEDESGKIEPRATVENIGALHGPAGDNAPQDEPAQRTVVRVRNTVTLCTQPTVVQTGSGLTALLPLSVNGQNGAATASGPWALAEGNVKYDYCRGETLNE